MVSEEDYKLLDTLRDGMPQLLPSPIDSRYFYLEKRDLISIMRREEKYTDQEGRQRTKVFQDVCLTTPGKDALSEFENDIREKAEYKREKRKQNHYNLVILIVTILTFVAAAITVILSL